MQNNKILKLRTKYLVIRKKEGKRNGKGDALFKVIGSGFFFFPAQNWMKNSLRVTDSTLQNQVWDIFSEATGDVS